MPSSIYTTMTYHADQVSAALNIYVDDALLTTYAYDGNLFQVSSTGSETVLSVASWSGFVGDVVSFRYEIQKRYGVAPQAWSEAFQTSGPTRKSNGHITGSVSVGGNALFDVNWNPHTDQISFQPRQAFTLSPPMFFYWWDYANNLLALLRRLKAYGA